ncbi:MAG: transcription elongation factor subunit Spt4 [Methanofastidiosum sp.]|jgi:DNA-directed RNA polymerase subunit E"|nr:transcription elongation factor subunit Spt4 [Methanofastidiosum sp.]
MKIACQKCQRILYENMCPVCKDDKTTDNWSGIVVIIDPEKSKIGKAIGVNVPGAYALKVRG